MIDDLRLSGVAAFHHKALPTAEDVAVAAQAVRDPRVVQPWRALVRQLEYLSRLLQGSTITPGCS